MSTDLATQEPILERAAAATKFTPREELVEMLRTLAEQFQQEGSPLKTPTRGVALAIGAAIDMLDTIISEQLAEVLHAPELQQLEGSVRGLHHLVMNTETGETLKIRVLNITKDELYKDLDKAIEFDQSQLFKKVYEAEYGSPGGAPYGLLIGDFTFTNHPNDVGLLEKISNVAAAAFCPFVSSASAELAGMESWTELAKPRDLAKIFESAEYIKLRSFRDSEDSRFVALTMPRVLARLPYGQNTAPIDEFSFEEVALDVDGKWARPVTHEDYTWMNAAYVYGVRQTDAFAKYAWCTFSRGAEAGGKVEGLPAHIFRTDDGDLDLKCPTEIAITDRREAELSKLGFLPLCHYKNTDYAVFFGAQTMQRAKKYDRPNATANAVISARLPYLMATSRIAHYLKVIARDKIGSFMELQDCQDWLDRWIAQYVSADPNPSDEAKARFPLAEAKVQVKAVPGAPGSYQAIAWLRPFLQLEELTTSLRLVASIPVLS